MTEGPGLRDAGLREGSGPEDSGPEGSGPAIWGPAIWAVMLACLGPELILSGADYGLWGGTQWRGLATGFLGFWPGLLADWRPNYPYQALAMFVTYGFLHAGPVHFAVNMMSLVSLGRGVQERIGAWGFLRIYGAALLGGGLGYGALVHAQNANATTPMVGASGALFGLAGALVVWAWGDRRAAHETLTPVWRALFVLFGLNVVLWVMTGGKLAWQTHLGGFVAGGALAWWEERRTSEGKKT
jgi:rhomboid protease GluP